MNYRLQEEIFTPPSTREVELQKMNEGNGQPVCNSDEKSHDYHDERPIMALALHMELRQLAAETASLHQRLAKVYPELIRFQCL